MYHCKRSDGKRNKLASAWLDHGEEFQKGNVSRPVGRGRESECVGLQEGDEEGKKSRQSVSGRV